MFSTLYFPLVSALATPGAVSHEDISKRFLRAVLDGNLNAASMIAGRWSEESGTGDDAAYVMQLQADLQLMLRVEVEAEEGYRRSQKMIRASKQAIRTASCRNAGWQALFRNRLGTALACFSRLADETGIDPKRAAEARFAIVCVLQELGRTGQASAALDDLRTCIVDISGEHGDLWRELVDTLAFDLAVQTDIRSASSLQDHVFWQSGLGDGVTRACALPSDTLEDLLSAVSSVRSPLLRIRIDSLRQQRAAACGDRNAFSLLLDHLVWARDQNLPDYQRTSRLEMALAALAGASPHLADAVLEPLHRGAQHGITGHRHLEYLYCASKMRQSQGRGQEAAQLYSRYALVAMQCLRADSHMRAPFIDRAAKASPQLDDVGARLTAKYRRAYYFVLENLDRRDLSVREVAAEIGVTERALQSAFRNFLGLSPTELIRRQRMERIRAELVDGSPGGDRGVLDAASRWGVENRSTLVNGYRKQFHEAPSETLER
ncbi:AraC-type DNA-binding protein [Burkholderia sp. D7]|nr:AraC-type DNA-binding protein [Burkholderia sp. D7]